MPPNVVKRTLSERQKFWLYRQLKRKHCFVKEFSRQSVFSTGKWDVIAWSRCTFFTSFGTSFQSAIFTFNPYEHLATVGAHNAFSRSKENFSVFSAPSWDVAPSSSGPIQADTKIYRCQCSMWFYFTFCSSMRSTFYDVWILSDSKSSWHRFRRWITLLDRNDHNRLAPIYLSSIGWMRLIHETAELFRFSNFIWYSARRFLLFGMIMFTGMRPIKLLAG